MDFLTFAVNSILGYFLTQLYTLLAGVAAGAS
jgi:hypothetical protein